MLKTIPRIAGALPVTSTGYIGAGAGNGQCVIFESNPHRNPAPFSRCVPALAPALGDL